MTQQYLRRVSVTLEGSGGRIGFENNVEDDSAQFRIRFDIRQNNQQSPNIASVIISNLSESTALRAQKEFQKITVAAGYRGSEVTLFIGEIFQIRRGREDVTDTYLHIVAKSGNRATNFATVNKSLASGHTYRDRVNVAFDAMKQLGVSVGHIADLPTRKFPRGFVCFGAAQDLMREIAFATGTSWWVQNDRLQLMQNAKGLPGETIVLNSDTGLIGLPVQTIQGIEARCLLNGWIAPGSKVKIDEKSIQQYELNTSYLGEGQNALVPNISRDGTYLVYEVNHNGDTRGLNFYTEMVGIRTGDNISAALAQKGISALQPGDEGYYGG